MHISAIDFQQGKSFIALLVSPDSIKTSQMPGFREAILSKMPELRFHKCDNGLGNSFADELLDTEVAHVFEHVLIEIISQMDGSVDNIRGLTTWNWRKDPRWLYRIEIAYDVSDTVLAALRSTFAILDEVFQLCSVNLSDAEDLSPAFFGTLGKS